MPVMQRMSFSRQADESEGYAHRRSSVQVAEDRLEALLDRKDNLLEDIREAREILAEAKAMSRERQRERNSKERERSASADA
jgi:hypothetical protein